MPLGPARKLTDLTDSTDFIFITRTLSEDFRYFINNGGNTIDWFKYVKPCMDFFDIIPELGYQVGLGIYQKRLILYVSGLHRKKDNEIKLDRAGREIRFSFLWKAPNDEMYYKSFIKIFLMLSSDKNKKNDIEKYLYESVKEIPCEREKKIEGNNKKIPGENVEFDAGKFRYKLVIDSNKYISDDKCSEYLSKINEYKFKYSETDNKIKEIPLSNKQKNNNKETVIDDIVNNSGKGAILTGSIGLATFLLKQFIQQHPLASKFLSPILNGMIPTSVLTSIGLFGTWLISKGVPKKIAEYISKLFFKKKEEMKNNENTKDK